MPEQISWTVITAEKKWNGLGMAISGNQGLASFGIMRGEGNF